MYQFDIITIGHTASVACLESFRTLSNCENLWEIIMILKLSEMERLRALILILLENHRALPTNTLM